MSHYVLPLAFIAIVYIAMIVLNEVYGLFATDRFPSPGAKVAAYAWLGLLLFGLAILVIGSALHVPTASELAKIPFYSLFLLHGVLIVFLIGWWLTDRATAAARVPQPAAAATRPGDDDDQALPSAVGGWIFTHHHGPAHSPRSSTPRVSCPRAGAAAAR